MSAKILDGKACAAEIEKEVRAGIDKLHFSPSLLIVTDGYDPASQVYIRNKVKAAERCGIGVEILNVNDESSIPPAARVRGRMLRSSGVIVQLPFQDPSLSDILLKTIFPSKDVDGLLGIPNGHTPCTPKGIITLLNYYDIPISGKNVVIIGRSNLVGRPLAELFLQRDATVTVCHSKTSNLAEFTRNADILVSAVGKPMFVTADMVKSDAVVVDVGINRVDGKLCGDVDFENVKEVASWITPVPGGVGPMTVASLMQNTLDAASRTMPM